MIARWLRRLLIYLAPPDAREDFAAELDAARDDDARMGRASRWWYWREAFSGVVPLLRIRARRLHARLRNVPSVRSIGIALHHDARFAVRQWTHAPMVFMVSAATLALGIGANIAILTVAWQAVLKPLPYPAGDRLVRVWETFKNGGRNPAMPANYRDWKRELTSLESIAAFTYFRDTVDLTGAGDPQQWEMRHVTGDYFKVFGMAPLVGRTLIEADERADGNPTVISESTWRATFGADPGIVNRTIRLGGRPTVVVGVMPEAFEVAAGRVQAWSILTLPPEQPGQRLAAHYLGVVGRLRTNAVLTTANAEITGVAARAAQLFPDANGQLSAAIESIQEARGSTLRADLLMLAAAALAVLLAACANLAGVQLARAFERRRELTIRAAIGASRARLLSQLIVETVMLALAGGGAGLLAGKAIIRGLGNVAPDAVRVAANAGFDRTIVLSALGLSLVAGLLVGVWPAWRASGDGSRSLRQRATTTDRGGLRARSVLLVAQLSLAVMLTTAAALLGASLIRVLGVDTGLRPEGVVAFDLSFRSARFEEFAAREAAIASISAAIRALPGVTASCAINEIPFDGANARANMTYVPEGQERAVSAVPRNITAGCLDLLGMRLLAGRPFADHESERVAIVTRDFATRAWPEADPIGRRVHLGVPTGDLIRIVGVASESRQSSLEGRPDAQFYEFFSERAAFPPAKMLVRTSSTSAEIMRTIRDAVRRVEPDQPVARLRPLSEIVTGSTNTRRFTAGLVSGFAILVLALAIVGTFALMSQVVGRRSFEFGIRLALGATPRMLVRTAMRQAWTLIAIGLSIGAAGAVVSFRLLQGLLYGVATIDVPALATVMASLAAVTAIAAWVPARRAARVDPMGAMKNP